MLFGQEKDNSAALQAKLDSIAKEHDDTYIDDIQLIFGSLKARHFHSSWNWVYQDALLVFYDIIFGRLTTVDCEITACYILIMNCADLTLLKYMQYPIDQFSPDQSPMYKPTKEFDQ